MLFLIIPLSLIFGSSLGIGFIIWRKAPYIKKLAVVDGDQQNVPNLSKKDFSFRLFSELSPELIETCKKFKFQEYKDAWLVELEKFLRRLRLLSLRMDRLSNSWIQGIRKHVYQNGTQTKTSNSTSEVGEVLTSDVPNIKTEEKVNEVESFKKEEQRIIIEIAKNPKDSNLYETLGNLYLKMGEYSDAKESFEAATELNPNSQELKDKLSFALEKINLSRASQK